MPFKLTLPPKKEVLVRKDNPNVSPIDISENMSKPERMLLAQLFENEAFSKFSTFDREVDYTIEGKQRILSNAIITVDDHYYVLNNKELGHGQFAEVKSILYEIKPIKNPDGKIEDLQVVNPAPPLAVKIINLKKMSAPVSNEVKASMILDDKAKYEKIGSEGYLVMTKYEGSTLKDSLPAPYEPAPLFTFKERLISLICLTTQLKKLHSNGFLHGDISAGNVMKSGNLIDMGEAIPIHAGEIKDTSTPHYRAPEAITDPFSEKTELFSLGCLIAETMGAYDFAKDRLNGMGAVKPDSALELENLGTIPNVQIPDGEGEFKFRDGVEKFEFPEEIKGQLTTLIGQLTQKEPATRPELEHVIKQLKLLQNALLKHDLNQLRKPREEPPKPEVLKL